MHYFRACSIVNYNLQIIRRHSTHERLSSSTDVGFEPRLTLFHNNDRNFRAYFRSAEIFPERGLSRQERHQLTRCRKSQLWAALWEIPDALRLTEFTPQEWRCPLSSLAVQRPPRSREVSCALQRTGMYQRHEGPAPSITRSVGRWIAVGRNPRSHLAVVAIE